MNDLTVFNNEQFGSVRTTVIDGEPWFVGKDVAVALGYKNPNVALQDNVEDVDKGVTKVTTFGGVQDATIINESGLYCLVFGSRLESAKAFRRWITSEVIPSIRKTGGYMAKPMTQLEIIAANAQALVDHERRVTALEESQKELADKLDKAAEAFTAPSYAPDEWQENARATIAAIVQDNGLSYQAYTGELYKKLESVACVDLTSRQSFKRKRMKAEGATYRDRQAVSKLSIIAADAKLRPIFDHILAMEKAARLMKGA